MQMKIIDVVDDGINGERRPSVRSTASDQRSHQVDDLRRSLMSGRCQFEYTAYPHYATLFQQENPIKYIEEMEHEIQVWTPEKPRGFACLSRI